MSAPSHSETTSQRQSSQSSVRVEEIVEVTPEVVEALERLSMALPWYSDPPSAEGIQEIIENPTTRLVVGRDGTGSILGMLTLVVYRRPTGVRAWFEDVAVATRGQGLGRKLAEEGMRLAREAGATHAVMIVHPSQAGALSMASRIGFGINDEDTRRVRLV